MRVLFVTSVLLCNILDDANFCTKTVQSIGKVFVAAIDNVDIAECRDARCGKHGKEDDNPWA